MSPPTEAPPGVPERLWLVTQPSGERHFLVREPLEGIVEWARGLDATVAEYTFERVTHRPPPRKKNAP